MTPRRGADVSAVHNANAMAVTNIKETNHMTELEKIEAVLVAGDLGRLSAEERVTYYRKTCESLGLNPLTKPFEYLTLQGKTILYATKSCTEQLRKLHGVSITALTTARIDDIYIVTATALDKDGKTDIATGAVNLRGLSGDPLCNAYMKCESKAKRRVTLSITGLSVLDESEIETVAGAQPLNTAANDLAMAQVVAPAPVAVMPKAKSVAAPKMVVPATVLKPVELQPHELTPAVMLALTVAWAKDEFPEVFDTAQDVKDALKAMGMKSWRTSDTQDDARKLIQEFAAEAMMPNEDDDEDGEDAEDAE